LVGDSTGAPSSGFAITPAAADHLAFLRQPTDTAPGQTIRPVVVAIVDQFGNVVGGDNTDAVTIAIGNNPGGGTLSGTLTLTVSGGRAEFDDLSIDLPGDGYTLHATADALTAADSNAFNIGTNTVLYVNNLYSGSVQRYDGSTGAFIDTIISAGSGGLRLATGIAFGPDGNLYVSSFDNGAVLRYDGTTGQFLGTFVGPGSGGLRLPEGLLFGPDGSLYVGSQDSDIKHYDANGAFLGDITGDGLSGPFDLTFGPDGNLYATSRNSDNVLLFDGTTGAFVTEFVPPRSGGLSFPLGLTFGPDDNLYVASGSTHGIKEYDGTTGAFLNEFVTNGEEGLSRPHGLRFGPDGNLYVPDPDNNRVLRYDGATGMFLGTFLSGPQLNYPEFLIFRFEGGAPAPRGNPARAHQAHRVNEPSKTGPLIGPSAAAFGVPSWQTGPTMAELSARPEAMADYKLQRQAVPPELGITVSAPGTRSVADRLFASNGLMGGGTEPLPSVRDRYIAHALFESGGERLVGLLLTDLWT
jgi:sugar lactone lactonase YvrE